MVSHQESTYAAEVLTDHQPSGDDAGNLCDGQGQHVEETRLPLVEITQRVVSTRLGFGGALVLENLELSLTDKRKPLSARHFDLRFFSRPFQVGKDPGRLIRLDRAWFHIWLVLGQDVYI
jgi:hypothetical protein